MPDETSDARRLKSVDQAFNIIEYLREGGPATLSEIANHFDAPLSTAHIHLSTLVENGYILKEDSEYRCSLRFLRTGGQLRDQMALYQAAKTEVDDLKEELGEYANLSIEENGYMVQLYKSESQTSIDDNASLGAHQHLHSTAMGKAILSQVTEEKLASILEKRGLPKLTEETITSRDALKDELETIEERQYAVNRGEHFAGVCAVAVPILSKGNNVIGAISVSGPLSRMHRERIENDIVPKLFNKKNIIELKIKQ